MNPTDRTRLESEARTAQGSVKGDVCPSLTLSTPDGAPPRVVYCDAPVNSYGKHYSGIVAHMGYHDGHNYVTWYDYAP